MREMTEAVPLRTALRVHVIYIIIGNALGQRLDLMLKHLATECGYVGYVKRQAVERQTGYPGTHSCRHTSQERSLPF